MSTHNICFGGEIRKKIIWILTLVCPYEYVAYFSWLLLEYIYFIASGEINVYSK